MNKNNIAAWLLFIVLFAFSHIMNMNEAFIYTEGEHYSGFPLSYYTVKDGETFAYFDAISFAVNFVFWFLASKMLIFAYGQITKYKVFKK